MKKENLLIAAAAGIGAAALTYQFLSRDIPKGATAIKPFDIHRYLGTWYEVARLPSWIEKNLNQVTENYSFNPDGTVKVITRAWNIKNREWVSAEGKIKFAGATDEGMLKVSYFRPVYFAYNILDMDTDYKYAMVSTSNRDYLWLLSRETDIPVKFKKRFLTKALSLGFDIGALEWV